MNLPKGVFLQTINRCNSQCIICPYKDTYRKLPLEVMSMELFEKILHDLTSAYRGELGLYLHYEPLMDKRLPELLVLSKKLCPKSKVSLSTNGALLNQENIEKLCNSPLDLIALNINGGTKETYEKAMYPLRWDITIKNVKNFLKEYKKSKYINFIKTNGNSNEGKLLRKIFPNIKIVDKYWAVNRGGSVKIKKPTQAKNRFRTKDGRCSQLATNLSVLCDGSVLLCCNCWKKEVVLGNAKDGNVVDIWNNSSLKHHNYDICKKCA